MGQVSPWRILVVVVLFILGVIYALPNIYGEDPAVQIASKSGKVVPAQLIVKIKQGLQEHKLKYKSLENTSKGVWVRFNNTDVQLEAQDVIRGLMSNQYTTSISLVPRTPHWLMALGAKPMKLGLDLRGGIHFLLHVELKEMVQKRAQADLRMMSTSLRDKNVHYVNMTALATTDDQPPVLTFTFADAGDALSARAALVVKNRDYTFELPSDKTLRATMTNIALTQLRRDTMQQNMNTLTNRVNALGISEATVQRQGIDQISLDLPGIQDTARAKELIGKVASLEFRLVDSNNDPARVQKTGIVPFGSQLFTQTDGRPVLLKDQVILHGDSIVAASAIMSQNGTPAVSVRVGSGVAYFHQMTSENVNKQLAVLYKEVVPVAVRVNGKTVMQQKQTAKVISVANINEALATSFEINGLESMRVAQDLALQLRSGAYTVPVEIVQNMQVGPTMGAKNISQGVMSTLVGTLLVFLFMAVYYRLFGLVADMALFLNLIFIIAILSILNATLTLPGIAGIVLTLGMAVDANVLINERIREELRAGISPLKAITAGYDRAFSTIVDANVTTLIVAVVLFAVSTTNIKSFAINLIIGLLTSMVTAIFFTRTVVDAIYNTRRKIKKLSIGIRG